jgi:hypothetical protein
MTNSKGSSSPPFVPPYAPSWVDRVLDELDRLPGPAWLAFLALGAVGVVVQVVIQSSGGDYQPGAFLLLHIWTMASYAYLLAMIFYLDKAAASAAKAFRPVLRTAHPESPSDAPMMSFDELRYRMTTLPPGPALWAAVLGALVLGLGPLFVIGRTLTAALAIFDIPTDPLPAAAALIHISLTQAVAGVLIFHTIHQLRLIHHVYLHHAEINLYRLPPLYAFSIPTALTAGGFLVYNYIFFAVSPFLLQQPVGQALGVFFSVIAAITFIWPLWGVHRRLVQEKKKLLQKSSARFEATVARLHKGLDQKRLSGMDELHKALASLELEQAALRRIPTWPWEPGTVRGVTVAVFLPIILWLIQYLLQKVLG